MRDDHLLQWTGVICFVAFVGLLALGSAVPVDAQRAAHHDLRYKQLSQTKVTLSNSGDTNETSFSSTAHQLRISLNPGDTETVHIAFGTTDADTDDITISDGETESRTFENVEVDNLNLFSNHGNDDSGVDVRIMALEFQ